MIEINHWDEIPKIILTGHQSSYKNSYFNHFCKAAERYRHQNSACEAINLICFFEGLIKTEITDGCRWVGSTDRAQLRWEKNCSQITQTQLQAKHRDAASNLPLLRPRIQFLGMIFELKTQTLGKACGGTYHTRQGARPASSRRLTSSAEAPTAA